MSAVLDEINYMENGGGYEKWLAGLNEPIVLTPHRRNALVQLAYADEQDVRYLDDHTLEYMYHAQLDALIRHARANPKAWRQLIEDAERGVG